MYKIFEHKTYQLCNNASDMVVKTKYEYLIAPISFAHKIMKLDYNRIDLLETIG